MNCGLATPRRPALPRPGSNHAGMEADQRNDYSGQAGPTFGSRTLTTRHNKRGHYIMTDGHIERMNHKQSVAAEKKKRFWFPTDKTTGPGGMNLAAGLE
ncbi:MAG: hypothetical protein KIT22_09780 [Verrucomicrobiae bacterium]|nr:hypothetical protein [Verrucomicrobiae bacterium]